MLWVPETDSFSGYGYAPFSEQVFNIPVAQVETVIQPDCVANNIGWESVALVGIDSPILPISGSLLGSTGRIGILLFCFGLHSSEPSHLFPE